MDIKELKKAVVKTPPEVLKEYQNLLKELNEGLPPATSPEVFYSAMKW